MTMYESAEKINKDLQQLFSTLNISEFSPWQQEQILNIIIRFGAVAKFRCRSNSAYKNFVTSCYMNIAVIKEVKLREDDDYTIIQAELTAMKVYKDFLQNNKLEDTKENYIEFLKGLKK